ncbi:MAG: putative cytosolic protein [Deltaproteobacteria bacterium]|nr:putative cytosolic protein [Deltaproteobacteria bacterium]
MFRFMKTYKPIDHTADLRIEISGKDEKEVYQNAGMAVHDLIADLRHVKPKEVRKVTVEGRDREDLLVNFLREILYLYNGEHWLLKKLTIVKFGRGKIEAMLTGEPFDRSRHGLKHEIKAVTYHQAEVKETQEGWKARVIFDV